MSNLSADKHHTSHKFLFDHDYAEQGTDDLPSITRIELETQVRMAFKEGFEKGVSETNADIQRQSEQHLILLTQQMTQMIAVEEQVVQKFHDEVAQICLLIAERLFPALARENAFVEVQDIVKRALENRSKDRCMVVEVHPTLEKPMQDFLNTIQTDAARPANVKLKLKDFAHPTDCVLSWEGAGIERYMDQALKEISATLEKLTSKKLTAAPQETQDAQHNQQKEHDEGRGHP